MGKSAGALGTLVAAGLVVACSGGGTDQSPIASASTSLKTASQGESKVSICHLPPGNPSNVQYITVGASAVPAHQAHGDGICANGAHDCCVESGPTSLCTDLQSDPSHCDACGHACPGVANGAPVCSGGACGIVCNGGYTACPSSQPTACVDTNTDPNNCGSCGNVCLSGEKCAAGACVGESGCADGTREGFVDTLTYPEISGCSGGWSVPGIMSVDPGIAPACGVATFDTVTPACGRAAGNDGANPNGTGCNVADLCSAGWHVCATAQDIAAHSPTGCGGATAAGDPPLFFASRQSSNGCAICATGTRTDPDCNSASCTTGCAQTAKTSNDLFGCGNFGATGPLVDCGPIDRFSQNVCSGLPGSPWSCLDNGFGVCEAYVVTKSAPGFGGVLCCHD